VAPEDFARQSEHFAGRPHLVLEELAQRLDELQVHALGQAADVVVALDRGRGALDRHRLDDVGVQRALREEAHVAALSTRLLRGILEHFDEHASDDLSLLLRVRDAGQRVQKTRRRIDVDEVGAEVFAELALDLRRFVLAQQAVVHEHARRAGRARPSR
jgi:hypothetical protein